MEQISNIASRQVNFKSQTKTQTSPIEAVKNKIQNMEDNEKITVGLTGAGILGMALLLINRPHKAKEVAEEIIDSKPVQEASQTISEAIENVVEETVKKTNYSLITETPKLTAQKAFLIVDERSGKKAAESAAVFLNNDPVELAKNALENGMGIRQVKKYATKNQIHEAKKLIKKQMGEIQQEHVGKQIAQAHANSNNVFETIGANKALRQINQGNITDISSQEILAKMNTAQEIAQNAQKYADEVREFALTHPTSQNLKAARVAQNKANEAKIQAQKIEEKGLGELMGRGRDELSKSQNITETPKVAPTAISDKQAKSALNRAVERNIKKGHGKVTEKQALEAIVKNPKENEQVRKLAQERLATL